MAENAVRIIIPPVSNLMNFTGFDKLTESKERQIDLFHSACRIR